MKRWNYTTAGPRLYVRPHPLNTRDYRTYTISEWRGASFLAEWRGGRNATYALFAYETCPSGFAHDKTCVATGLRTMSEVIEEAGRLAVSTRSMR